MNKLEIAKEMGVEIVELPSVERPTSEELMGLPVRMNYTTTNVRCDACETKLAKNIDKMLRRLT